MPENSPVRKFWKCPSCQRIFKARHQWHSCRKVEEEVPLKKSSPEVLKMYQEVKKFCASLGKVHTSITINAIFIKCPSTFVALKPGKNWLDVEFFTLAEETGFPVFKSVRVSKNRWACKIRYEGEKEIWAVIKKYIRESYKIVQKKRPLRAGD
jgi:uncharacterized C2H2 Zn-finger protein